MKSEEKAESQQQNEEDGEEQECRLTIEGKNWRRRSDDECREARIAKSERELRQLGEKRRAQGSLVELRMARCREDV